MEEKDIALAKEEIKGALESLSKTITDYHMSRKIILSRLKELIKDAIEDHTVDVDVSIDLYEGDLYKEEFDFKAVLSWSFPKFGPPIWLDNFNKIAKSLNLSDYKLIPHNNTFEIYISLYALGIAVGCSDDILLDE